MKPVRLWVWHSGSYVLNCECHPTRVWSPNVSVVKHFASIGCLNMQWPKIISKARWVMAPSILVVTSVQHREV